MILCWSYTIIAPTKGHLVIPDMVLWKVFSALLICTNHAILFCSGDMNARANVAFD